jgi:hypothetical protein
MRCNRRRRDLPCRMKNNEDLLGGKEGLQGCQVPGIFNTRTNHLRQLGKEMGTRSRKLIAADNPTVLAEPFFDPLVVEDSERNRRLPDPPCTNESDRFEVFGESDNLLNQFLAPEAVPRGWGRQFTNRHATKM